MRNSLYDALVANPDQVSDRVALVDRGDPQSRLAVLVTIQWLLNTFVAPVGHLLSRSAMDPTNAYYDLRGIAGSDFSGLLLGLLKRKFPALQLPPGDAVLATALECSGIEIAGAEQRADFFGAWMAQRTTLLIRELLPVVEQNLPDNPAANAAELAIFQQLLQIPQPSLERYLIRSVRDNRAGKP